MAGEREGPSNKAAEGRQAYKDGLPREQNPYQQGSMRYWQWLSGWLDERAFRPRGADSLALSKGETNASKGGQSE